MLPAIFGRAAILDQHQPVGGQLDHVAVVADQDDRAFIAVQRLDQRLAASTSRWLVGSSRISRCGASRVISASASRARSPPDSLRDQRRRLVARKTEAAELGAHRRRASCRSSPGSYAAAACHRRAAPRPGTG